MTLMLIGGEVIAKFVSEEDARKCVKALSTPKQRAVVRKSLTNSEYCKQRRAEARRHGICIQCNFDDAEHGKSKCRGCRETNKAKRLACG